MDLKQLFGCSNRVFGRILHYLATRTTSDYFTLRSNPTSPGLLYNPTAKIIKVTPCTWLKLCSQMNKVVIKVIVKVKLSFHGPVSIAVVECE